MSYTVEGKTLDKLEKKINKIKADIYRKYYVVE